MSANQQQYTITIFSENVPGLLYRVAGIFLKRKVNIESLTVSETEKVGISRFTIVILVDRATVETIARQLHRIIEVTAVHVHTDEELIHREIAMIRIAGVSKDAIGDIEKIISQYWAHIIHHTGDSVVVEIDGNEEKINSCLKALRDSYTVTEFIRSGRIAISHY